MHPFQTVPSAAAAFERALWFRSEQFDHTSDLPPEHNGGNQRYGADLGMHLCAALENAGIPSVLVDEDWGWLVMAEAGENVRLEVSIYNLDDKGEPTDVGAPYWGLVMAASEQSAVWGLFTVTRPVAIPQEAEDCVVHAVSQLDANFSAWSQGMNEMPDLDNTESDEPGPHA